MGPVWAGQEEGAEEGADDVPGSGSVWAGQQVQEGADDTPGSGPLLGLACGRQAQWARTRSLEVLDAAPIASAPMQVGALWWWWC